jgi:hypothetical protein
VAHAHTEFAGQPSAGLSAESIGHDLKGAREPDGALGAKWEQVGQGFSKRAASAGLIIAEKAPQVEQQADHVFTDGEIAWGTAVAAMHTQRWLLTGRAGYLRLSAMCFDYESHINRPHSINGKARNEKWQNRG